MADIYATPCYLCSVHTDAETCNLCVIKSKVSHLKQNKYMAVSEKKALSRKTKSQNLCSPYTYPCIRNRSFIVIAGWGLIQKKHCKHLSCTTKKMSHCSLVENITA